MSVRTLLLLIVAAALTLVLWAGCSVGYRTADMASAPAAEYEDPAAAPLEEALPIMRMFQQRLLHGPGAGTSRQEQQLGRALAQVDEVWIIEVPRAEPNADMQDAPGCGALLVEAGDKEIPVPLKHTEVTADISGYIASVNVQQQFHNPYDTKIEAVYVFPLPSSAAVNEFLMTIGDRAIRGIIKERGEAEEIYEAAKRQGYSASLLTQERPNIFTQKVANIEPGKSIDINIRYFNTLEYKDGWYEFAFPMVVGPRYNPPHTTDGIGAVPRGGYGTSGQDTEIEYLPPNERSGHDIGLTVNLDAGVSIEDIESLNHLVSMKHETESRSRITLNPNDTIPNKDFVLRWKVASSSVKKGVITHTDDTGSYFSLMLYPPEDLTSLKRQPVEFVFVLDCSGSMNGYPMMQSKIAMKRALRSLQSDDTFQVIRFSEDSSYFGPRPVTATRDNIQSAIRFVEQLSGTGGTQMIEGIKAALDFPHDPKRLRLVTFMTDGYIGNEMEIFNAVHRKLGDARIFSFGVGSSVNRYLIEGLARLGNGAVAYVGADHSATKSVDAFFNRVAHPAMTDLAIDWNGLSVDSAYPQRLPDLFVGRPVILTGRIDATSGSHTVSVRGRVGSAERSHTFTIDLDNAESHPGLAPIWARAKIAELSDSAVYASDGNLDIENQILDVALRYGLMSQYTAYVAVDSSRVTEGDSGVSVNVPVPVPDGVKYDTTVPSRAQQPNTQSPPAGNTEGLRPHERD
jgi:Ca-activated chloride channel family protein